MSAEGHFSHDLQAERADLIRLRLQHKSPNNLFNARVKDTSSQMARLRQRWNLHFPVDPVTGLERRFHSDGSNDKGKPGGAVVSYPWPLEKIEIPSAPIDFTPASNPEGPSELDRKKRRLHM
jgi:hypothetical protein